MFVAQKRVEKYGNIFIIAYKNLSLKQDTTLSMLKVIIITSYEGKKIDNILKRF